MFTYWSFPTFIDHAIILNINREEHSWVFRYIVHLVTPELKYVATQMVRCHPSQPFLKTCFFLLNICPLYYNFAVNYNIWLNMLPSMSVIPWLIMTNYVNNDCARQSLWVIGIHFRYWPILLFIIIYCYLSV